MRYPSVVHEDVDFCRCQNAGDNFLNPAVMRNVAGEGRGITPGALNFISDGFCRFEINVQNQYLRTFTGQAQTNAPAYAAASADPHAASSEGISCGIGARAPAAGVARLRRVLQAPRERSNDLGKLVPTRLSEWDRQEFAKRLLIDRGARE